MKKRSRKTQPTTLLSILFLMAFMSCTKEIDPISIELLSNEKQLIEFGFLAIENRSLKIDVISNVDENTILVVMPYGTDVSSLKPTMMLSDNAVVIPDVGATQDYTNPVDYVVIAEDGTESNYTVITKVIDITEREILVKLFEENPDNTLGWVISSENQDENIASWEGVLMVDGKIIGLDLSDKGLSIIPPEIGSLFYLKELSLANNALTSIPPEIGDLANNLRRLILNHNNLLEIPVEVCNLINLTELDIDNNLILTIPSKIKNISQLELLFLRNNSIVEIPTEIGELISLEHLYLSGNVLRDLPEEIIDLKQLNTLYIGANPFAKIPEVLFDITSLEVLGVNNINLTNVSSEIENLIALTRLDISGNLLADIPSEIGSLAEMSILIINNNSLTAIPSEISNLSNLTLLRLTDNPELTTIPDAVCDLINVGTEIEKDAGVLCE